MPKMRVHEVAKLFNKSSKEVIAALKQQGIEVQSHMSTVTEENIAKIKAHFHPTEAVKKPQPAQANVEKTAAPVKEQVKEPARKKEDGRQKEMKEKRPEGRREFSRESRNDNNNRNNDGNRSGRNNDGNRNFNNRNNDGNRNFNNRNNDGNRGGRNNDDGNRGFNNRSNDANRNGRNNDRRNRSKSVLGGDTPINAKETRNGKENRHDINREHSRENNNRNNESRESRGGKNNRRNNNNNGRNNGFNTMQKRPKNKAKAPVVQPPKQEEPKEDVIRNITLPNPVSLKDLAEACKVTPAVIIKKLFLSGQMVTINTEFPFEEAADIALEYNCIAEEEVQVDVIEELLKEDEEDESKMVGRPPVVCVMGHVDHGKTSLLDAIRSTHVTEGEAGGITQHIGAYVVNINDEKITFLDTPGHEAFTSMRLRGAQATDIAVLVVAADDGVMPQTIEAINHAKAAEVEVIVAVNKIDKEGANVERVKQELTEYGLIAEDWGGSTVFVPVSAKTGEGIDDLLEMITLTAEVL